MNETAMMNWSLWLSIVILIMVLANAYGLFFLNKKIEQYKKNLKEGKGEQNEQIEPKKMSNEPEQDDLKKHIDELFKVVTKDFLLLKGDERVFLKDIMYFTIQTNYVEVVTEQKTYTMKTTYERLLKRLPPNFLPCNTTQIVNEDWVSSVDFETGSVVVGKDVSIELKPEYKSFFNL